MQLLNLTLAEPQHFSLPERLLLIALIAVSVASFWRRFGTVLEKILQSKKDAGFRLFPIGTRVGDFVWEVLCQAKVIRQRPLPGLAHASVFWGFCAFVLVTLNHFATGLGLGFLSPEGRFGRFYFDLAAVFALACAAGILGLFVRRFLVRPKWLGEKLSYQSGIVAFLIFLLMVTYLASFFVADASPATRFLWWVHTLALLSFLPIIPHTKHLHLMLSPATVFLSRGGFSQIPSLVGDEDFGLVAGTDLTQLVSLQAYSCVECGRCTEHCPAANTGKLLNPKEIILGLRGYLNDLGPTSSEPLLGKYNSQEAAFQCTTCGACEFQCPVGIEHLPIIVGLRRGAVNTEAWENDYGAKLFLTLERGSNALGLPASDRDKFIDRARLPLFDGTQEYCLWLGCMGGYDPKGREIVADLARVMNYLGARYGVLRKEKCTGDPVRRLGNDLLFQQLAEENLKTLADNKVKRIITICPHCVRTIQEDWKEYGTPPPVEHHSEFLARFVEMLSRPVGPGFSPDIRMAETKGASAPEEERAAAAQTEGAGGASEGAGVSLKGTESLSDGAGASSEGAGGFNPRKSPAAQEWALAPEASSSIASQAPALNVTSKASGHDFSRADKVANISGPLGPAGKAQGPEKIVFHDPCYLGRYRNVYEEPRKVVAQAGELVEAPRNRERSFCCGAGGGLAFLGEETGERVSHVRATELIATGAKTVATACPFCNSMFRDALAESGEAAPQLLDIAQLAARALPKDEVEHRIP
jgi:Fe-S oxidoreductase